MSKENIIIEFGNNKPSCDEWFDDAKKSKDADKIGIYLLQNGVVRSSGKEQLYNKKELPSVKAMKLSVDKEQVKKIVDELSILPGIYYLRIWVGEGLLNVNDNIMQILIGADCRDNCVDALNNIIKRIKRECVNEKEIY